MKILKNILILSIAFLSTQKISADTPDSEKAAICGLVRTANGQTGKYKYDDCKGKGPHGCKRNDNKPGFVCEVGDSGLVVAKNDWSIASQKYYSALAAKTKNPEHINKAQKYKARIVPVK